MEGGSQERENTGRMVDQETKRDRSWPFNVSVLSPVVYHRGSIAVSGSSNLAVSFLRGKYRYACVRSLWRDRVARSSKLRRGMERNFRIHFPFVLIKTSSNQKPETWHCISDRKKAKNEERKIKLRRNNSSILFLSRLLWNFEFANFPG